jgi:hypothetical protein
MPQNQLERKIKMNPAKKIMQTVFSMRGRPLYETGHHSTAASEVHGLPGTGRKKNSF